MRAHFIQEGVALIVILRRLSLHDFLVGIPKEASVLPGTVWCQGACKSRRHLPVLSRCASANHCCLFLASRVMG